MSVKIKSALVNAGIRIMSALPLRRVIVFESTPDFACNAYPLYEKLKSDSGFSSEYRLMWLVTNGAAIPNGISPRDVIYDDPKTPFKIIKSLYYRACAKCFVMSNRVKNKARKDQLFIFLCHGSKTKRTKGIYEIGDGVDYVLCQSHFFDDVICEEYNVKKEKLVYLGYPRCDALFEDHSPAAETFGIGSGEKFIIWLPTYRKHKGSSTQEGVGGIPLIRDSESAGKLSRALSECGVKVLLKPHPAEDVSAIRSYDIANFEIITDRLLAERGVQLYELISASSALVSDYSSVFYDYLLCDKPMGLTTDDEKEYTVSRGFALDLDLLYGKSAMRLSQIDDLIGFVRDVSLGEDRFANGREEVKKLTNIYTDGMSAERCARFIKEKLG